MQTPPTTPVHPSIQAMIDVTLQYRAERKSGPVLWTAQAVAQDEVNRAFASGDVQGAQQMLLDAARGTHSSYAQYDGYWDTWVLGTLRSNVRLKGLGYPLRGDVVLVDPVDGVFSGTDEPQRSFYSVRRDGVVGMDPRRVGLVA